MRRRPGQRPHAPTAFGAALGLMWGLLLPAAVLAAEDDESQSSEHSAGEHTDAETPALRPFNSLINIGPTVGWNANGLCLHLGSEVGAIVSGGYAPVLATFLRDADSQAVYRLYHALQIDADAKFPLVTTKHGAVVGVRPGYRFSTVLGHGVNLGGYSGLPLSESWTLDVSLGLAIYPGGAEAIRRDQSVPSDASFGPLSPWLQGGLSLALLWAL